MRTILYATAPSNGETTLMYEHAQTRADEYRIPLPGQIKATRLVKIQNRIRMRLTESSIGAVIRSVPLTADKPNEAR